MTFFKTRKLGESSYIASFSGLFFLIHAMLILKGVMRLY